jgi:hypothetical protein
MKVMSIFQIAASDMGAEDKFTAALTYLIDNVPEIGQEWASLFARAHGLAAPIFERAEDHPEGDAESRPDFLLACKQFDIMCEHKLDSKLGKRQLERYLALPKARPTRVALITNWDIPEAVSEEVLRHPDYLKPIDSDVPYFSWQLLYPIIAMRKERLAKEFAAYMHGLGMAPLHLPSSWDDLFSNAETAAAFQSLTKDLKVHFKGLGATCKGDGGKLGVQIQHPNRWLHLLYIYVSKTTKPFETEVDGPFLSARIFLSKGQAIKLAKFKERKDQINIRQGLIVGREVNEGASWNKDLELAYEYVSSLEGYLTNDASQTRENLLDFGRTVFAHAAKVTE